jgi:pyridoxal phosphate enzyme (YggS family)
MTDGAVGRRLDAVRSRLDAAAAAAGRDPGSITLIAVSKTQPAEAVTEAIAAGVTDVGENRVQEGTGKRPDVAGGARWHLIGPLQRNKARPALETFDVVHTLDRPSLADRLQYLLSEHWPERTLPVLLEVNIGREPQKKGVLEEDTAELARRVLEGCPALQLRGLMAIPPVTDDAEGARPYFAALRALRGRLQDQLSVALPDLSMGMSHDFVVAVAEGATMVRVGTAIFGPRRTS